MGSINGQMDHVSIPTSRLTHAMNQLRNVSAVLSGKKVAVLALTIYVGIEGKSIECSHGNSDIE